MLLYRIHSHTELPALMLSENVSKTRCTPPSIQRSTSILDHITKIKYDDDLVAFL